MQVTRSDVLPLRTEQDIVLARQAVRKLTAGAEFRPGRPDQDGHGRQRTGPQYRGLRRRGRPCAGSCVSTASKKDCKLTFEDQGPGIPDLSLAMKDGWTSGTGLGMGLSGTKRLVNEFEIFSKVGEGTRVAITRWK